MMILIGFAPNPANPRKILWWLYCYAWWPDEFLGNFSLLVILLIGLNRPLQAEQLNLKPFTAGSYQQILENNVNQPFMLVVWSITCSSCLKDMHLGTSTK